MLKNLLILDLKNFVLVSGSYNKILFNEISKEIGRQSITLIIDLKKSSQ